MMRIKKAYYILDGVFINNLFNNILDYKCYNVYGTSGLASADCCLLLFVEVFWKIAFIDYLLFVGYCFLVYRFEE